MMSEGINWTDVLVVGVPAWIAAIGAAVAAVITALNRRSLRTSNGKTIAAHVEETHAAVTESVAELHELNGNSTPNEPGGTSV